MEGLALSMALNVGRVYLYHPDGDNIFWETRNPYCLKLKDGIFNGKSNFYFYFKKCNILYFFLLR
jgi:hypothetical protein